MQRVSRLAAALAALAVPLSAADAQMLRCKGDLVFEDSLARAAILFVDMDQGVVTTPSCYKYPELRGFCAGGIVRAKNHQFAFGSAVSEENAKIRIELMRTSNALGTDTVLNWWPRATFLGRCEPTRSVARHHRT